MLRSIGQDTDVVFAAVGQLQFEVMQYRLKDEYNVETSLNRLPYDCSAWIIGDLSTFSKTTNSLLLQDRQGRPIALFPSLWDKQYAIRQNPKHKLAFIFARRRHDGIRFF